MNAPGVEATSGDVWVVITVDSGRLDKAASGLLRLGGPLADRLGVSLCTVVLARGKLALEPELLQVLKPYGVDTMFLLGYALQSNRLPDSLMQTLAAQARLRHPGVVLCGDDVAGRDCAARLAAKCETELIAGCTGIRATDDEQLAFFTRPVHGGKALAVVVVPHTRPQVVSYRTGREHSTESQRTRETTVERLAPPEGSGEEQIRFTGFMKGDPGTIRIDEAEVIVGAGRGVSNPTEFRLVQELAKVLGAPVAGSLPIIDAGLVPPDRQIGQTGKTVSPRLYVACGISGTTYHVLGMKDSETVFAINTDRYAPIFKIADIGVLAAVRDVVPLIIERLKKGQADNVTMEQALRGAV